MVGSFDWDAIEDRTREVNTHTFWDNPADIISTAAHSYREDLWADQRYRPEVWIEKEALLGVIEGVCTELRVPVLRPSRQQLADAAVPGRQTLRGISRPRSNSAGPAPRRPRSRTAST